MILYKIIAGMALLFFIQTLQAQRLDKIIPMRGADSLWIYDRAHSRPLYFIGDEPVDRRVWLKHLEQSDIEVSELMKEANHFRKKGVTLAWVSIPATVLGTLWLAYYDATLVNNQAVVAIPITLMFGGIGLSVAAGTQISKSNNKYNQALRLFNAKSIKGTLIPISISFGLGDYGAGLVLQW
jgi:hypothetical protein